MEHRSGNLKNVQRQRGEVKMKIQAHDAHYSFDYTAWVNAVFDVAVKQYGMSKFYEYQWGIAPETMAKFFRYKPVSLPTMLQIQFGSGVPMEAFVTKID